MESRLAFLHVLLALALLYAAIGSGLYFFEAYPRHRVESSWLAFAALLAAATLVKISALRLDEPPATDRRFLAVVLAGALALYAGSLSVGLLSDDYTLLAASARWALAPPEWEHFRPLPLGIWAVLSAIGLSSPILLHALNVTLHGLNAYLTASLGRQAGMPRAAAMAAAALFLVFPGAVEAVTWVSGLQDVLMTTFVIGFLIASLRARHGLAITLLVLGTLTKETAVCAPVLLVLMWPIRRVGRAMLLGALGWSVVFSLARLLFKPSSGLFDPISSYFLKELLVGIYGGLAMPWMREQMFAYPWLSLAALIAMCTLLTLMLSRPQDKSLWVTAGIWIAWILVAALPVYRYFHISPDLQGSRYLYLPSVGWSLLLSHLAFAHTLVVGRVALAVLLSTSIAGSLAHQQRWRNAAKYRDHVLYQAAEGIRQHGCRTSELRDGPDSHRGVYVFRNGLPEATARMAASDEQAPAECVFEWKDGQFVPLRLPR